MRFIMLRSTMSHTYHHYYGGSITHYSCNIMYKHTLITYSQYTRNMETTRMGILISLKTWKYGAHNDGGSSRIKNTLIMNPLYLTCKNLIL